MNDHEPGTPEYVIRSILYGVTSFPEGDIPETVTALIENLRRSGLAIVRTDDHLSRKEAVAALEGVAREWRSEMGAGTLMIAADIIRTLVK